MRSIVPSDENPAESARRAHSVTCSPVTPGIVAGSPIPTSIASPSGRLGSPRGSSRHATDLVSPAFGVRAGGPPGAPRRPRRPPGPARHVRAGRGRGVDRGGPKAQAHGRAGAVALPAPPAGGRPDGGPLRGRLG